MAKRDLNNFQPRLGLAWNFKPQWVFRGNFGLVTGDLAQGGGNMYSHGLSAIVLCEAYAMTQDNGLRGPAQLSLNHIMYAQDPVGGGWRYTPRQPGDTSVVGWQLMALHSAELGGIPIPTQTRARMVRFLQSCSSGRSRGLASYRPGPRPSRTMTAEALVCRYFLSADNAPATIDEAAACIVEERPGIGATRNAAKHGRQSATMPRR